MNQNENKKSVYFHGECMIKEIEQFPEADLKKRYVKDSIMIAESETIGNEHRIKIKKGIEFYEDENGILYMKNTVPTDVYCLHENRHDTIELPAGLWEINRAKEYDYIKDMIMEVKD